jgi:energy-converting hydrogenase Eha subunit C
MDHEAYENEMIDAINRHGEEAAKKEVKAKLSQVVTKNDARIIVRGLKRTLLALLTAATLALAVMGLITVATAPGYLAVVLFFASVLALIVSVVLLYAQGIIRVESKGESK